MDEFISPPACVIIAIESKKLYDETALVANISIWRIS
jgi:hypothetical protein